MKLLVVDDAPEMLKAFRDILEAHGCEVHEAENGEEALIMDILMPKLDGISATKRILENDPWAKIIVISAVGKSGLAKECLLAGAKEFIVKPFKIRELLSSIDRLAG
jgi:two-component system chemotaxis response regulator CheY